MGEKGKERKETHGKLHHLLMQPRPRTYTRELCACVIQHFLVFLKYTRALHAHSIARVLLQNPVPDQHFEPISAPFATLRRDL